MVSIQELVDYRGAAVHDLSNVLGESDQTKKVALALDETRIVLFVEGFMWTTFADSGGRRPSVDVERSWKRGNKIPGQSSRNA